MTTPTTSSVTAEYLLSQGIDPACPMRSARTKGAPLCVRFRDDLITRRGSDGGIQHAFGYFTPHQTWARAAWAQRVFESAGPLRLKLLYGTGDQ